MGKRSCEDCFHCSACSMWGEMSKANATKCSQFEPKRYASLADLHEMHQAAENAQMARCIENMTDKMNALIDSLPRWIRVEERLPEKHTGVIACCDDGYIAPMVYDGVHWNWNGKYEDSVTHWMPLPDAPKED